MQFVFSWLSGNKLYIFFLKQTSEYYDVAIVGAGPAGSTCGYFLGLVTISLNRFSFTFQIYILFTI